MCVNPFRENLRQDQSRGSSTHTRPRGDQQQFPLGSPLPPLAKLYALVTSLGLMDKLLSLPKDASLHLRKLAGHP